MIDADDLYVVHDDTINIEETSQRGEVGTVERESNKYIFVGPMQRNKTALYQIIDRQCMRSTGERSSNYIARHLKVSFIVFRTK